MLDNEGAVSNPFVFRTAGGEDGPGAGDATERFRLWPAIAGRLRTGGVSDKFECGGDIDACEGEAEAEGWACSGSGSSLSVTTWSEGGEASGGERGAGDDGGMGLVPTGCGEVSVLLVVRSFRSFMASGSLPLAGPFVRIELEGA